MNGRIYEIDIGEALYPESLRNIYNPPKTLYIRGELPDLSRETAIAVIGTRKASPYGLKMGRNLAYEIARCGGIVISGLTAGIDAAAAEGALLAGGRVIGVLGTSVEDVRNELAEEVVKSGCLVSEYPAGSIPNKTHFRARNRIAAGLSEGVVVVEAPEKSGTRLFVAEALEQGKQIFAVPGNADSDNSAGTLQLIKEGAMLVTHGWEVAEEYPGRLQAVKDEPVPDRPVTQKSKKCVDKQNSYYYIDITEKLKGLSPAEIKIVKAISAGCRSADEIANAAALPISEVSGNLTMLQIKGTVKKDAAGFSINMK